MINGPIWDESQLEGQSPSILAIGDSWFWYLFNNLANPLYKILNKHKEHVILVRGHNGAETQEYVSGPVRKQIELDLNRRKGYGRTIKAVLISGGGNDFAGRNHMESILKSDCSAADKPEDCFRQGQPARLMGNALSNLLNVVDLVKVNIPNTPVIVHGYDYANPNGIGFLGLGQWLQFPMDEVGVKRRLQQGVVNVLIDTFAKRLEDAAKSNSTIKVVDARGMLSPNDWVNELHPFPKGFNRLAKKWEKSFTEVGLI